MRYVLWTLVCAPGANARGLAALEEAARGAAPWRLVAAWNTEFGETGEILALWNLADDAAADAHGPAFPATPQVQLERVPLEAEFPCDFDFTGGHLYDFRCYTLAPGARDAFLEHMRAALPARKRHSRNVGVWTPSAGNRDQIIHIWAYRDLAERDRARGAAWQEPAWLAYLEHIFPLTRRMRTALLVPAPFSPMQ